MTTPSETALSAEEEVDLFAPHDLGCRCYPHVSQRAAIEAAVRAATTEYRAARLQPATEYALSAEWSKGWAAAFDAIRAGDPDALRAARLQPATNDGEFLAFLGGTWTAFGEETRRVLFQRAESYLAARSQPATKSWHDGMRMVIHPDGTRCWHKERRSQPATERALAPIRGLRITADDIDAALAQLGPTGDRAEAYVKVAALAAAAALRALAATEPAGDER